ncbi:MAG: SEL1-like repeat protein [Methylobacter sp.]
MPHLKLFSEIDSALAQAQDKDRQDTFFLYRADHDPDYAARQKSGEERRQHWLRRWRMFRESLARLGQNAWANFFDQHPLLVQLTLSYPVFVFLAIALDKDAIGLPVGGTAALAILIVLGLAVRKLTGLIAYGASRFLMVLVDLLGNLAHSFSIRWRRGWRNAVALWNKLINLIQNAWGYFINRRLLVAFTSFFLFLIVLFGTLSVSGKYPESFRNSIPAAMQIQANPVENLNNPVSSEASARLQKAAETANIERQVYQGKIYFLGKGVSTDLEKGAQWLDKAAAQGDARLKTDIAKLYQKTEHVDYEVKAFDLLQKAATNDFPEAQYELAMAYFLGVGITQSLVEHLYWLQKAANHGVAKAQIELSRYYDSKGNYTQATLWLKKAADQIDPQSQFALSSYYYYLYEKKGGEINKTRAFEFAKKAADQDDASAQGLLAFFYFQGIGVKENQDEALAWATKGDAQENAYAQNVLGGIYNSKGDYKKAFAQFQKAAVQEFPLAQFNLGKCYLDGKGTKPNEAEAMKWFKKAADHNETIAQIELAKMYKKQNNIKETVYWLREAATGGDASAQYKLCAEYHFGKLIEKNFYKAFEWCQKAADKGHIEAQSQLGTYYLYGKGTKPNEAEAMKWFKKAADHNETIAQIELAKMYEKQNNIKEAVYWLQKAATGGGDASAQYSLCNLYHFSKFIETDLYKAFGWCRKAAVQGLMEAQHDLGLMYGQALGTQQDIVRAYAWTMVAANQIDGRGKTDTIKEELAENEKMLTPKQFADAKHLAANWKKGKDL